MDFSSVSIYLDYYIIDECFLEVFDKLHIFSYCFITFYKEMVSKNDI